jgi:hypothetical protein
MKTMPAMKILGKQRARGVWFQADRLMRTVVSLRETRLFMPKGIHRFDSFAAAHQWAVKMMARREEKQN